MKSNLCVAYWGLLLVSLISSCLLFIIVASEATKTTGKLNENNPNHHFEKELDIETYEFGDFSSSSETQQDDKTQAELSDLQQIKVKTSSSVDVGKNSEQKVPNSNRLEQDNTKTGDAQNEAVREKLPDIPATPAVITLGEKSADVLMENHPDDVDDDDVIPVIQDLSKNQSEIDLNEKDQSSVRNEFVILSEVKTVKKEVVLPQEIPPDEQPNKIDDSGGTLSSGDAKESFILVENKTNIVDIPSTKSDIPENNLTVEEKPIPVFSEWAQKQMEEAEKQLEKQVVNSSFMKKNATTGNKPPLLKLRAKNYASPDCGAKIIASNSEAQNTGALLTSSKDEYMLSPCTNRIWFVVELCEAIQAEKIELANFELFSSSPKNFSVAVNNRFPTRDWSNVGRFLADDQRNIQSFELFPHLFGKFVRVDIHSHYNSEHFCPISLFRVYGTSEFEAFETENRPPVDDVVDEFDDDDVLEQNNLKNENNLFKSASDAVMSIVKKAAEVLVKTNPNKTDNGIGTGYKFNRSEAIKLQRCFTPKLDFRCEKCNETLVTNVNYLLSCKYYQLTSILSIDTLKRHIFSTQICANRFNLDPINVVDSLGCKLYQSNSNSNNNNNNNNNSNNLEIDEKKSYLLSLFPIEYLAAMCHILATPDKSDRNSSYSSENADTALNLTIDQKTAGKFTKDDSSLNNNIDKELPGGRKLPKLTLTQKNENKDTKKSDQQKLDEVTLNEFNELKSDDLSKKFTSKTEEDDDKSKLLEPPIENTIEPPEMNDDSIPNVNIFNIVDEKVPDQHQPELSITGESIVETVKDGSAVLEPESTSSTNTEEVIKTKDIEAEPTSWENIDNMILTDPGSSDNLNTGGMDINIGNIAQTPQRPHSESVFLRLSNRVKSLERNMSLSGQYLEELSRRYKKQVEELQHSFAKTLSAIEDQNRRAIERESLLFDENKVLRQNIDEISNRLNSWISLVICLGSFVFFQIIVAWFLIRSFRRQQLNLLRHFEESSFVKKPTISQKRICRRKSVEGVSGHPSPTHKVRRPSEEAMRICGSYKDLMILEGEECEDMVAHDDELKDIVGEIAGKRSKQRQRKPSVFYGRTTGMVEPISLPLNKVIERKQSAPCDFNYLTTHHHAPSQHDDPLILDEDYETYIPGTDLVYNEFMPDGPSGSQSTTPNSIQYSKSSSKKPSKMPRLSPPGFLKSPFNRGNNKKLPHGPTGWEWYRLKKSERNGSPSSSQQQQKSSNKSTKKSKSESPEILTKINGFGNTTPNSSISEFMPNNSTNGSDDSLRTSYTSTTTGSILSNGNNSSSKKQGSFRKIFRKVF